MKRIELLNDLSNVQVGDFIIGNEILRQKKTHYCYMHILNIFNNKFDYYFFDNSVRDKSLWYLSNKSVDISWWQYNNTELNNRYILRPSEKALQCFIKNLDSIKHTDFFMVKNLLVPLKIHCCKIINGKNN